MIKNIVLLAVILPFISFAQSSIDQHINFEKIINVQEGLNYRYPSLMIKDVSENKLLLLEKKASKKEKKQFVFQGVIVDLEKEKQQKFQLTIHKKCLKNYMNIENCSYNGKFLLVNFKDRQFIYKWKAGEFELLRETSFDNSTGQAFVNENGFILSSVGMFNSMGKSTSNYFRWHDLKNENQFKTQEISIEGKAFFGTKPSNFTAHSEKWSVWVEPINHTLIFQDRANLTFDTVQCDLEDWMQIDGSDLKELQEIKEPYEVLGLTRELGQEISRVWRIAFLDETSMASIYSQPTEDGGFDFRLNVFELSEGKWQINQQRLRLMNHLEQDSNSILSAENFPFRFGALGNAEVFTKDYVCIITEESVKDYNGLTVGEYFNLGEQEEKRLRLHVFKHDF